MGKRRHSGSLITATGDASDGVSDSIDCGADLAEDIGETEPDYQHGYSASSHAVEDLKRDIRIFDKHSKVPEDLGWHVHSPVTTQNLWYKRLSKAWRESEPTDPDQATRLVYDNLQYVFVEDLWGFLYFYGLPLYHSELHPMPSGEALPDMDTQRAEDAPVFELWTLPVDGKSVTDECGFTVNVELEDKDFYLLPQKILSAACARRRALAKGDNNRARELRDLIDNTPDYYEFVDLDTREVLTRKYHIMLRGIRAAEIGTPNGTKARDELAKMVSDKFLTISVYYFDEKERCVGDVYCGNKFLQKILLKKGAASGRWTRDAPGVEKGF
ncbi:hypothetical protein L1987_47662 [Smallanthus sonchifolius]|uniref:Uncharacterized protein n=5 Tax=Smallanthus sonchifolius TaxID=185202 RepID=A0ACB9G451_9ASTR|nr:hypothetical protein L1987_47655 [Smallanthus sonchifolius]KAI3777856.1 hypothetical protein L1987_47659 [Smallanthus sonchifolius]KAI3777857.1 hypothetical protein L1987_47660 [Smallanthus sonchifolius]KAI3777858.1 hypothetical protein L1987_47661 [Smallanthus sonchifolius]KAI3777859.1 hypothetical protein L1987_47662 [Smallanthus sonchifolius]